LLKRSKLVKNTGDISLLVCGTEHRKSKSVLAEEVMHLLRYHAVAVHGGL